MYSHVTLNGARIAYAPADRHIINTITDWLDQEQVFS